MLYLKAIYNEINEETKEKEIDGFRHAIISTSQDVPLPHGIEEEGQVWELTSDNFMTNQGGVFTEMLSDDEESGEILGSIIDRVEAGVWPLILVSIRTDCVSVVCSATKTKHSSHCTTISADLDPNVFPNGVKDLLAMIEV